MKRALVSVTDKTNIGTFCKRLENLGFEIISTGGTYKALVDEGVNALPIEEVTNFPEILDGRVKTLNPYVHGGILFRRDLEEHNKVVKDMKIGAIDLVCVNLYEFEKALKKGLPPEEMIEQIDIGGPSMVRSAAKNYKDVLIVTEPSDYEEVISKLEKGEVDLEFRRKLAYKAFNKTAAYDSMISRYFAELCNIDFPETLNISMERKEEFRYGENSQQKAYLYKDFFVRETLMDYEQLNGKTLSFNNLNDLYGAVALVREFKDEFVTAAIKHSTPCGVAIGTTGYDSYIKAYEADSKSIFGGIVACNYKVEADTAKKMSEIFLEIIAAPDFSEEALEILRTKKNLRVLKLKNQYADYSKYDIKYLEGNALVQEPNKALYEELKVVTDIKPSDEELEDMLFGLKVVKHEKSNAICIVKGGVTLAIGSGQTSRVWALENAINNNKNKDFTDSILVSDAFFPFDDCVRIAAKSGVKAIIQPGGSIRDEDSIKACNELGISMVFSNIRHFRH